MKRKLLITLAALLCVSMTAFGEETDLSSHTNDIVVLDDDDYKLVLHNIEPCVDYEGKPSVALELTTTVKGDQGMDPLYTYDLDAYQNNRTIEHAIPADDSPFRDDNHTTLVKIKNGASQLFATYFLLDDESMVEFEFSNPDYYGDTPTVVYYDPTTGTITTEAPAEEAELDYKDMYGKLKIEYDELLEKYNELIGE